MLRVYSHLAPLHYTLTLTDNLLNCKVKFSKNIEIFLLKYIDIRLKLNKIDNRFDRNKSPEICLTESGFGLLDKKE